MDECFEVISVYSLKYRSESGVWLETVNPKEASNMEAWLVGLVGKRNLSTHLLDFSVALLWDKIHL